MQNYGQVIHNLEDRAALYMTTDIASFGCSAIYIVKKNTFHLHLTSTFMITTSTFMNTSHYKFGERGGELCVPKCTL